jgi:hypothetical protein
MVFGMNFFVFCFVVLIAVFYFSREIRNEGFYVAVSKESFGMSPGTLDQLKSTHVPTDRPQIIDPNRKPDQDVEDHIQANLTKKAIMEMTPPGSLDSMYAQA